MKSIDLRHRLAAVLLAVCLVVCCALPAFATSANIVLGRLGSLHVRLYDTHNDVPLRGGELTLYQVATVKRTNGNLYFDYTGDFTGCGVVLGDLSDSTLADQLVKYLPVVPAIAAQQDVNEEGYADITKLPQGLYLVVQTEASHGYEAIKPFLVSIPMPDVRCGRHPQGRRYHPGNAGHPRHPGCASHTAGYARHTGHPRSSGAAGHPGYAGEPGQPR